MDITKNLKNLDKYEKFSKIKRIILAAIASQINP